MVISLSKSTIKQSIWENFYDRIKNNVTSVSITGPVTVTIKTYTNSFPDSSLDEKGDYPIIVVNSPEINWKRFTFRKKRVEGTISIDVHTTQSEAADKFSDAIANSIESYTPDLKTVDLFDINLESAPKPEEVMRGGFKAHISTCTFNFKYNFTESVMGS